MISITCALLATLLQQWARRYLKATQPRLSVHKQARIRSFFAEGVEKSFLPSVVEALPTLLHISLFLFFAGLVVFLWNVNLTIYKIAMSWIGVCATFYGCVTLVPIFLRDSPYYTPLTPLARLLYFMILRVSLFLRICFVELPCWCIRYYQCNCSCCCPILLTVLGGRDPFPNYDHWLRQVLRSTFMTAEEVALKSPPEIDARAFMWTFDSLDEDYELERFFSSLSDFRSSKVVDDPLPSLTASERSRIVDSLISFVSYTFSSDLLPEVVKMQRAMMCAKALDTAEFDDGDLERLRGVIFYRGRRTTNFGSRTEQSSSIQAIATEIIAWPPQHDDSWFRQVAPNVLGIPETVLRSYAANGKSLSLAILIYVTRQQFTYCRDSSWPTLEFRDFLEAVSKFNVQDTLPELQHEFCTLWNQIVLEARKDNDRTIPWTTLKPLRAAYVALHRDYDNNSAGRRLYPYTTSQFDSRLEDPFLYPVCEVASHVHGGSPSTSFVRTVPDNNTVLVPPSIADPDVPSLSISAPLHVFESSTDVPLIDNIHSAQTAKGACAGVMRDIDTSVITICHPTPETSASAPLSSSIPVDAVTLPHNADLFPDLQNLPSSVTSSSVLDNMLRTGKPPSLRSPVTRSSLSPSCLRLIVVSTAPSASPEMTIAPYMSIAAEDNCNPMIGLRKDKDTSDRPLVNRATHAATPHLPQQSPPVQDLGVALASQEPDTEHTGDPPDRSCCRYNIV